MDLTLHVWHHFDSGSVDQKLEQLLTHLETLMAKVEDVAAAVDALVAKVAAEEGVLNSVPPLLSGLSALIADLRSQLAAALAAGADPAALQAIADKLAALGVKVDADKQKITDAVVANPAT